MQVEHIGNATLYCGDCLTILPTLQKGSVDMVLTDPPYSSGGLYRGDRNLIPQQKYMNNKKKAVVSFCGDNRDQRSFTQWCALWASQILGISSPGAIFAAVIDWRNLACLIDSIQMGGWIYRGIVVWDKTEGCKPQKGWYRGQCEYFVTATNGKFSRKEDVYLPGCFRFATVNGTQRVHMTQKPVPLLEKLLEVSPDGCLVLDPFMGSSSTGVAALQSGRKFVGIEATAEYFDIACRRIEGAARG